MTSTTRRQFLCATIGGGGALGLIGAWRRLRSEATAAETSVPADMATLHLVRRNGYALGAEVSVAVLAEDQTSAERAAKAALAEVTLVDRLMSLYRQESQISRLNRDGALANPHPYLVEVFRHAEAMSRHSDGAFDISVQPLWSVYAEAGKSGSLPEKSALQSAQSLVDWRRVRWSDGKVQLLSPGMAVTLNGIAQGYAADRVVAVLRRHGIRHALVNTGEISVLGQRIDGTPWTTGIQHPRQPDAYLALAQLQGRCLSTSGDYATTFSKDCRHHHLLDPHTGRSPQEFSSVSIAAATATEADALSTAVFVLGPEKGLELVRATPEADALLVYKSGKTLATAGFPSIAEEQVTS